MQAEVVASERKHQLDALTAVAKANRSGVKDEIRLLKARGQYEKDLAKADPHRSTARRIIAYVLIFAIAFVVPGMVLFGDLQWFHLHEWTNNGFFGIGRREVVDVVQAVGLPLIWLDGLLTFVSTIVGFYFGGSAAKFNNPYTQK